MEENKKIQNTIEQYKKQNNYDLMTESGRHLFLGFDQEQIIRRNQLEADDSSISFRYLSFPARILRDTCEVQIKSPWPSMISSAAPEAVDHAIDKSYKSSQGNDTKYTPLNAAQENGTGIGFRKASPGISMTVYEMFTYSLEHDTPVLSGEWASVSKLGGIIGAYHASSLVSDREKALFLGKADELKNACLAVHGSPSPGSADVSAVLPVFDNFPVWFQFWDGDDEFPVNYQFLLDQNALHFIRYETVWYLSGTVRDYLEDYIHGGTRRA